MHQPRLAYAGTVTRLAARPLPVVTPPADPPPVAGPFPPAAPFAGHRPYSAPPVAGPPFAPPPAPAQESNTGLRVVVAVAIATVVVVLLGCLAGGFLLTQGSVADEPAAVEHAVPARPEAPPAPVLPTAD